MRISLGLELLEINSGLAQLLMGLRKEALRVLWEEIAFAGQDNLLIVEPPIFEQPYVVVGPALAAIDCLRSERFIARCLLDRAFAMACLSWC